MARITGIDLAEGVAREALKEQKKHKESQMTARVVIVCLSALLLAAMICGTIIAVTTIREQQRTLNMQYVELMDYVKGCEITTVTETTSANSDGDGSVAIIGDNNTANGGAVDGE